VKKRKVKKKTATKGKPVKKLTVKTKTSAKKKTVKKSAVKTKTSGKKKTVKKSAVKTKTSGKKKTVKKSAVKTKTSGKKKTVKKSAIKTKTSAKKKKATVRKSSAAKEKISKISTTSKKKTAKKLTPKKKTAKKNMKKAISKIKTSAPNRKINGDDYMSPTQIEGFKQLLLSRKRDLLVEVERTVHHMRDEASNFPDPNDRATQEEEFALELRTRDRERKLVRKIDEALLTLDSGDYGYCEVCGIEIGAKRLEARPTATLCIDCKTLDEIKERQLS